MLKNIFYILSSAVSLTEAESKERKKIPVGGQAVIEGVLMKGNKDLWGLAVRRPNGELACESWPASSRTKRLPWKLPFLRGVVTMCEMMGTGFKALSRSAEIALEETQEEMTLKDLVISIVFAVIAVGGLFIALPMWSAEWVSGVFSLPKVWTHTLEGVARALIFITYIAVIGMWGDIRRVFCYHGAEHKTIDAFERGLELTPENVMSCSRIHPRCGTSFLLIAVIVSIAVFSCIGVGGFAWRVGSRIVLLPLVIGISYEVIRLASNSGTCGRVLISPFLSLQYLTTREPDLPQAETAIAALNTAMRNSGAYAPNSEFGIRNSE